MTQVSYLFRLLNLLLISFIHTDLIINLISIFQQISTDFGKQYIKHH